MKKESFGFKTALISLYSRKRPISQMCNMRHFRRRLLSPLSTRGILFHPLQKMGFLKTEVISTTDSTIQLSEGGENIEEILVLTFNLFLL